jgi:hypothetical protein
MARELTKLRIDEVSAVDRGAGEDCKILLRKRDQNAVAKAINALKTSVGLILDDSDIDDATKRSELAETFGQFESYLDRNVAGSEALSKRPLERAERERREKFAKIFAGKADDDDGDDVAKAETGAKHLVERLLEHAHDALDRHRKLRGYEKSATNKESSTMDDNLTSISKSHDDLMSFCKRAVEAGEPGGVSENTLVEAVTKIAAERFPGMSADAAFTKMWTASSPEAVLLRKTARLCRDGAWGYASA